MRKAGINLSKELARMDFDSPFNPKNEPQWECSPGRPEQTDMDELTDPIFFVKWTQMDADGI